MNRLWASSLLLLIFLLPAAAHAQSNLPLFDPEWQLVPEAHELDADCPVGSPLGFGGALQLIQNVMNAAISFGVIIMVLVITFAGILWLLTPTNPENHSQAKKVLTNAVIGLLILLSAWLIVDFVMKLLYNGNTSFGPWNEILTGGDICITAASTTPLFSGNIFSVPGQGGSFSYPLTGSFGACNPATLQTAASQAGITLSASDARMFACLAGPESTCGTRLRNYNWGRGSSAYGAFQVLLDGNSRHYENAACRRAAGLAEGERLNCHLGFRNGNPIPGSPVVQRCINAASNLSCSLAAAVSLKNEAGSFSPWRADANSARQRACMAGG